MTGDCFGLITSWRPLLTQKLGWKQGSIPVKAKTQLCKKQQTQKTVERSTQKIGQNIVAIGNIWGLTLKILSLNIHHWFSCHRSSGNTVTSWFFRIPAHVYWHYELKIMFKYFFLIFCLFNMKLICHLLTS